MGFTNKELIQMSDVALISQIGSFIKHKRLEMNFTQATLAERSGLNRWTLSQIENGEAITLTSLIQILRSLDCLYVLSEFKVSEEISPLEYAKLKRKPKLRARQKIKKTKTKEDIGW